MGDFHFYQCNKCIVYIYLYASMTFGYLLTVQVTLTTAVLAQTTGALCELSNM